MCLTLKGKTDRIGGRATFVYRAAALPVLLAVAAVWAVGAGCQDHKFTPSAFQWQPAVKKEPTNAPIATDPAMETRNWPEAHAYWANGTVVAGPTRFPYTYQTVTGLGLGGYQPRVLDSLLFVYQVVRLPFTYFVDPPFTPKMYRGAVYEPTYTAMPQLAPESGVIPKSVRGGSGTPDVGSVPGVVVPPVTEPATTGPTAFEGARPTTTEVMPGQPRRGELIVPSTTPAPGTRPTTLPPLVVPEGTPAPAAQPAQP